MPPITLPSELQPVADLKLLLHVAYIRYCLADEPPDKVKGSFPYAPLSSSTQCRHAVKLPRYLATRLPPTSALHVRLVTTNFPKDVKLFNAQYWLISPRCILARRASVGRTPKDALLSLIQHTQKQVLRTAQRRATKANSDYLRKVSGWLAYYEARRQDLYPGSVFTDITPLIFP